MLNADQRVFWDHEKKTPGYDHQQEKQLRFQDQLDEMDALFQNAMAGQASKHDFTDCVKKLREDPEDLHLLVHVQG